MTSQDRELLVRIDENVMRLVTRVDDHETRIRSVERRSWVGFTIMGVIAAKLGLPHFNLG